VLVWGFKREDAAIVISLQLLQHVGNFITNLVKVSLFDDSLIIHLATYFVRIQLQVSTGSFINVAHLLVLTQFSVLCWYRQFGVVCFLHLQNTREKFKCSNEVQIPSGRFYWYCPSSPPPTPHPKNQWLWLAALLANCLMYITKPHNHSSHFKLRHNLWTLTI
jgi:hypothetical protein